MLVFKETHEAFSEGAAKFTYTASGNPAGTGKILVKVRLGEEGEEIVVDAVLDTGAPYFVCGPELAEGLGLDPSDEIGRQSMIIRGAEVEGFLSRVNLELIAEEGTSRKIDVTAFVPLDPIDWPESRPNFIGYKSCLDRLRFAVDPQSSRLYFGFV